MSASDASQVKRSRLGPRRWIVIGALLLPALVFGNLCVGDWSLRLDPAEVMRARTRLLGGATTAGRDSIVELRLWQAITSAGVGAALGLSGALVQGLFR